MPELTEQALEFLQEIPQMYREEIERIYDTYRDQRPTTMRAGASPNTSTGEQPPDNLSHTEYCHWYWSRGLEAPSRKIITRDYPDKLPFRKFSSPHSLNQCKKYPAIRDNDGNVVRNGKGEIKRKNPRLVGRGWFHEDYDERQYACHDVYTTKRKCVYPTGNQCYANHNLSMDYFIYMVLKRDMPLVQANYYIKNAMSNPPEDMVEKLWLLTPENLPSEPPKGTMSTQEIDLFWKTHRFKAPHGTNRPIADE